MENGEIKDRIAHIIRAKNLTAAEFAVRLSIQPSNISHLLAGRNNPSLDFVRKLKETFPEYNLDWIIMGDGPITVSEPFLKPAPIVEPDAPQVQVEKSKTEVEQRILSPKSGLKNLIMVYEDGSFEMLLPR